MSPFSNVVRLLAFLFLFFTLNNPVSAASGRTDYDLDDDGLIEIDDLADLNEIRNNLDGTTLYGVNTGCPAQGCNGFELTTNLDFDTNGDGKIDANDDYWNDGLGWEPIGTSSSPVTATFDGNGHQINNLVINRNSSDYVGLFGYTNSGPRNIGLSGNLMTVTGYSYVGGLVGNTTSNLNNCYVTGSVTALGKYAGGLAGRSTGDILDSYATGNVTASNLGSAGGLVGTVIFSNIVDSYATGNVSGNGTAGGLLGDGGWPHFINSFATGDINGTTAGGLAGSAAFGAFTNSFATGNISGTTVGGLTGSITSGSITTSFATGSINGTTAGGLAGSASSSTITFSYWATDSTGQSVSSYGASTDSSLGDTLANLQCPTVAGDTGCNVLFVGWDETIWDFGTSSQLPGLIINSTVYRDSDGDGALDVDDAFPSDPSETLDTDNDGIGNNADTDDDGDQYADIDEIAAGSNPLDSADIPADNDGDFVSDVTDTDDDNDGVLDVDDAFPLDASESVDTDNDGIGNNADTDDDGDQYADIDEIAAGSNPLDSADIPADNDGDFVSDATDTDDDNDGVLDVDDAFPLDASESVDTDNDGIGNNADSDDDGDQYADIDEIAAGSNPLDSADTPADNDGDFVSDVTDTDDDNDGVLDVDDAFPFDASESVDTDNDGIGNNADTDDDGDQYTDVDEIAAGSDPLDTNDIPPDFDSDFIPDVIDTDDDNDGYTDTDEITAGSDPLDANNIPADFDGDFIPNVIDTDDDNDGYSDSDETTAGSDPLNANDIPADFDGDFIPDVFDDDDDNDSVPDDSDAFPFDSNEWADFDGDGTGDNADTDDDNDGVPDNLDSDNTADNGAPEMQSVGADLFVSANQDAGTSAYLDYQTLLNALSATDMVDAASALTYQGRVDGEALVVDQDGLVHIPTGLQVIVWTATDTSGNVSSPMEQVVSVYPQIRFVSATSTTGEASSAEIGVIMSGESPEYPVSVQLSFDSSNSTATAADFNNLDLEASQSVVIEAGTQTVLNIAGSLTLNTLDDSVIEADEVLLINLDGVVLSNSNATNYYLVDSANAQHSLTLTDTNLAPQVTLTLTQNGESVTRITIGGGDVTVTADISDGNGNDSHSLTWDLDGLATATSSEASVTFSADNLTAGDYIINVTATDSGIPALSDSDQLSISVIAADNGSSSGGGSGGGGGGSLFWLLLMPLLPARYCCRIKSYR